MVAIALKSILKTLFPLHNENEREVIHLSSIEAARMLVGGKPRSIDLLLLDLSLDDAGPNECIQILIKEWCDIPTIVITGETSPEIIDNLIQAGVVGIIPKTAGLSIIGLALLLIDAGKAYYPLPANPMGSYSPPSTRSAEKLPRRVCDDTPETSEFQLPPQLSRTLDLLEGGLSNKEIAKRLNVSVGTAKNYVATTLRRLGISRRTQLLGIAKKRNSST